MERFWIREGIKHIIECARGVQIVGEAGNGHEALELIDAVSPHIILTDIVMQIMDGEELTDSEKPLSYPEKEAIMPSHPH
ncbi:response regulator [Peribacillus sp. SCS-155]|uniref:response regulator n=1 Tax=Peribacillus sedimenti TaxID=3115297 RepID=UPI003905C4EF